MKKELTCGAKMVMTYKELHKFLMLPEENTIVSVFDDPDKDVVTIKMHSSEPEKGRAYLIGEGQQYPNMSIPAEKQAKHALGMVYELMEMAKEEGRNGDWARRMVEEFEEELNS